MTTDDFARSYMDQLYTMTEGNMDNQVSMYEVGINLGLEKAEAGALAEDLMVQGLVELKTLAGAIGITSEGLTFLGVSRTVSSPEGQSRSLSNGPVVSPEDMEMIEKLQETIRQTVSENKNEYSVLEELVIDLKTIDVQLLSPHPKTEIIRALFRSCEQSLRTLKADKAADTILVVLG